MLLEEQRDSAIFSGIYKDKPHTLLTDQIMLIDVDN
jgi:hypothetical protein